MIQKHSDEVCDVKSASLQRKHRFVSNLHLLMGCCSTDFVPTPDVRLHTEYRTSCCKKSKCDTRWYARVDAAMALSKGCSSFKKALQAIAEDMIQKL
ncbi:hypothetical protein TNIN_397621 [Trichonephila inaurata madagascariensis]|uniref:Uncharacterized protein n=1 Tax=Trichonephila inaurata madagascariensis TaxID=2747483 RepID=A0A8X6JIT7_9ARAC|nr:hypothetical protein TNIN_397621 [Trichonephila inaurata madagascariensis]